MEIPYHLLENIVMWNKPDVKGIAKKMVDRNQLKSKYCTQKAPEAFSDLIKNINARYILVSYNNMAQKEMVDRMLKYPMKR